eukprot:NODE_7530_length_468_cov_10.164678_g7084_i0.p3 GENE.NODE_7530_length_468_cov_10.164678_g7084_i0~~NODE_7530_length_468_cov_10.164678_g7084_i0.p3  ORF type:complete len:115 (+),score=17.17 NODE_7530_length_468_cov_10.164678_g7084_i0:103-447(+)
MLTRGHTAILKQQTTPDPEKRLQFLSSLFSLLSSLSSPLSSLLSLLSSLFSLLFLWRGEVGFPTIFPSQFFLLLLRRNLGRNFLFSFFCFSFLKNDTGTRVLDDSAMLDYFFVF